MNDDLVVMTHPRHPGLVRTITREAFDRRSSKLGWVLADSHPGEIRQHDNPGEPADRASGSVDERENLAEKARSLGLKVHPRAKAETIRRQILKAQGDL